MSSGPCAKSHLLPATCPDRCRFHVSRFKVSGSPAAAACRFCDLCAFLRQCLFVVCVDMHPPPLRITSPPPTCGLRRSIEGTPVRHRIPVADEVTSSFVLRQDVFPRKKFETR